MDHSPVKQKALIGPAPQIKSNYTLFGEVVYIFIIYHIPYS